MGITGPPELSAICSFTCAKNIVLSFCLAAFVAALRNRRVQAAIKYWAVLVVMLVGTLMLEYFLPVAARLNPSFGYTAAAVGMSDRVESTVFKVGSNVQIVELPLLRCGTFCLFEQCFPTLFTTCSGQAGCQAADRLRRP